MGLLAELGTALLHRWSYPLAIIAPMQRIEELGALDGALLRVAYELAARLADEKRVAQPIPRLSCGRLDERDVRPVLVQVRREADELRGAVLGD